jgi:hypothetical protein
MALSNQSDLPAFFSPRKVNLKISLISEDDLRVPRMAKSRKMTYREWPNPGRLTEIGQIPAYVKPEFDGFDDTNSLKPSSGYE